MTRGSLHAVFVIALWLSQNIQPTSAFNGPNADRESAQGFSVDEQADRLVITHSGRPVAEFIFRDKRILRPFFANIYSPRGIRVTRSYPPIEGVDATDHDTMHPGLWLGFGDISGTDFWRNMGTIEQLRFSEPPVVAADQLTFATESRLVTADGNVLCNLTCRFTLVERSTGWLLIWDATMRSDEREFTFGDQEEMGFGARVATPLTEKNGGIITSSAGRNTAAKTWGQTAQWCDYSGTSQDTRVGITLMAAPDNFRESWWHNRDYGAFVANPFGRSAMKQGAPSRLIIKPGSSLHIQFAASAHDTDDYDAAKAYEDFLSVSK